MAAAPVPFRSRHASRAPCDLSLSPRRTQTFGALSTVERRGVFDNLRLAWRLLRSRSAAAMPAGHRALFPSRRGAC